MASIGRGGRSNVGGSKRRSPTSNPHRASRVEPSREKDRQRRTNRKRSK